MLWLEHVKVKEVPNKDLRRWTLIICRTDYLKSNGTSRGNIQLTADEELESVGVRAGETDRGAAPVWTRESIKWTFRELDPSHGCILFGLLVFKSQETEYKHGLFLFLFKNCISVTTRSPLSLPSLVCQRSAGAELQCCLHGRHATSNSSPDTKDPLHLSPSLYCILFHDREIILYNEVFVKTKTKSIFLAYTWRTYLYCLGTTWAINK